VSRALDSCGRSLEISGANRNQENNGLRCDKKQKRSVTAFVRDDADDLLCLNVSRRAGLEIEKLIYTHQK
jgi:hypothetical protein